VMSDQYNFAYEWCDIPEGMTAADYRALLKRRRQRRIRRRRHLLHREAITVGGGPGARLARAR